LEKPILDVSTKLEITDRYINWKEAEEIAGLSNDEIEEMKKITMLINDLITKEAKKAGLTNEDGKVEYGFDEYRNMMIVDVIGTPDECRFTFNDTPVSKEIARIYYRNTPWYEEVKEAKKKDRMNWKSHVSSPPPLPPRLAELISMLYQACCNEVTGRRFFDAPSLREIVEEIKEYI
jgi:phosphoribosylaminoimidazole-succinocarboxamide synthase